MRIAAAASLVFAVAACSDCKGVTAPTGPEVEAGAGVASGICSYIDGIDDTGIVRTICATVAEVAQVVEFILTLRTADGGAPTAACKPLPSSTLCATSAERAKAILFVSHVRQALLTLDAGAR